MWLSAHDLYAVTRDADVRAVLKNPDVFCSGKGVGLNDFINTIGQGTTLMSDGDQHRRLRDVILRPSPRELRRTRPTQRTNRCRRTEPHGDGRLRGQLAQTQLAEGSMAAGILDAAARSDIEPGQPGREGSGHRSRPGPHAGRRTVVTGLFVDGHEALEDIAGFVGHAKPSTTAGYVKRLGRRPEAVARRAAEVLDAHAEGESPTA